MSHLATWRGQPRVGINHAVAAQGWAAQTDEPRLQAYADDVAARAYAKVGQSTSCLRQLESIETSPVTNGESEHFRMHLANPAFVRDLCFY